jgi:hypothetical protein
VVSGGLACVAGALLLGLVIPALRTATLAAREDEPDSGAELPQQPVLPG